MKALSFKPPWGQMVVYGIPILKSVDLGEGRSTVEYSGKVFLKNIENRSWKLPAWFKVPQRIYVHSGKREDDSEATFKFLFEKGLATPIVALCLFSSKLGRGAIIGEVDIIDCVEKSDSPWFVGPYGFVLANPVSYEKPIPCRGKLGFFEPEEQGGLV